MLIMYVNHDLSTLMFKNENYHLFLFFHFEIWICYLDVPDDFLC